MRLIRDREDRWGIADLQECILEVGKYLHDFCVDNNIVYYLMGGSALGAIRHKGFIPWDDDMDVFMTVDEYERFRKLFKEKGDQKHYYLQEQGACDGMITSAKLRLNSSTLIEESIEDWDIHHGVFIDIFLLHGFAKHKISQYWQYFWTRYIVIKGLSNRKIVKGCLFRKNLLYICRITPRRFMLKFALKQLYRYKKSDYYCHLKGKADIKKGVYEKDLFGIPRLTNFEKIQLYVPCQVEKYLEERWGDYMKIPPQNEVKLAQHAKEWDVEKPFKPRKNGTFEDEKYFF